MINITLSSLFKLAHVCYTCFNLFAIDVSKSSSAWVFCLGGNFTPPKFGVWILYLELDFRSDLDELGGGGIYIWKSLYTLSATNVSNESGIGVKSFWPAFTNYFLEPDCGRFAEEGLLPDFDDYLDFYLLFQLFYIWNCPFMKALIIEYQIIINTL